MRCMQEEIFTVGMSDCGTEGEREGAGIEEAGTIPHKFSWSINWLIGIN